MLYFILYKFHFNYIYFVSMSAQMSVHVFSNYVNAATRACEIFII